MARKKSSTNAAGVFLLVLVGLPLVLLGKITDTVGVPAFLACIAALIVLIIWYKSHRRAVRLAELRNRYQDEDVVQKIMRRLFWQGQTAQQLSDSLGGPVTTDQHLLKTKKREIWKYQQTGVNRFKLRITLENDIVVGWDQK